MPISRRESAKGDRRFSSGQLRELPLDSGSAAKRQYAEGWEGHIASRCLTSHSMFHSFPWISRNRRVTSTACSFDSVSRIA